MNRLDSLIQKHGGRALLGLTVYQYDPAFVELIAYLGFDAIWIEMEHSALSFSEAGDLCRIASGNGLLTMIRIPDSTRENVLKAAELGPDIIDVSMVNDLATAQETVRHSRYPPIGNRGFFGVSRAVRYGVGGDIRDHQKRVNRELCLMIQIETRESVECAEELCAVQGIDAVFLGPGDLSASFGVSGDLRNCMVVSAMEQVIRIAKSRGLRVAAACAPVDAAYWARAGVDLLFCGGSLSCQRVGAEAILKQTAETQTIRYDIAHTAS